MDVPIDHPFFFANKQLLKICKPLFQYTPITFFVFGRLYYDGNCIFLSQEPELDYFVFKQDLMPTVEELHLNSSHYVLMSKDFAIPEMAIYPEPYLKNIQITAEFGIPHRLFLLFYFPTHIESFEFGINQDSKNVMEFFMNHVQILEKFCTYFRDAGRDLINHVDKTRVSFDNVIEPIHFTNFNSQDYFYNEFLDAIKLKKYAVQGRGGNTTLSEREFECLLWSAKDKTAKQIGKILSLSPRTIEDYLLNVKNKLGCKSKLELIELANKDSLMKSFID